MSLLVKNFLKFSHNSRAICAIDAIGASSFILAIDNPRFQRRPKLFGQKSRRRMKTASDLQTEGCVERRRFLSVRKTKVSSGQLHCGLI
jgi:hypothetical protein